MIRKARTDDMNDLLFLWNEMMGSHLGMHPDFRISKNADMAMASNFTNLFDDTTSTILVAEEDNKVVGMLIAQSRVGLPYTRTEKTGYFRDVSVTKSFRGMGIGKKLVEAGIKFLVSLDVEYIDLITGSDNEKSNEFWEKMGFEETLKIRSLLLSPELTKNRSESKDK